MRGMNMNDLLKFMNNLGFYPKDIAPDGEIYRFDRDGYKNAWYWGLQSFTRKGEVFIYSVFGDWKTGEEHVFKPAMNFSREDKAQIDADIEKARCKAKQERLRTQQEVSIKANAKWLECSENPNSDYLKKKGLVALYGARTIMGFKGRELVVPMRDIEGKLWGLQTIQTDAKYFMEGQRKEGCFHIIGETFEESYT